MADFEKRADRSGTDSFKWGRLPELCPGAEDPLPFWIADMEFAAPPEVTEALAERIAKPVYSYTMVPDSFYESVMSWYERRHGWAPRKEEILPTSGVLYTLASILDCFTEKTDPVILNLPAYNCFLNMIKGLGHPIAAAPLAETDEGYELDPDAVELQMKAGAKAYVFCTPHNPTGRVWKKEELRAVVELCEKYDVLLIADEIHSDLILPGSVHTPIFLAKPERTEKIFLINSPSKTFNIPAMNAAYVICRDTGLRKALADHLEAHENSINFLGRIALEAAYGKGESWLEELLPVLKDNAKLTADLLKSRLPGVRCCVPEATFLMWLDFSAYGFSQKELMEAFGKAGVGVSNGSDFGAPRDGFVRFNIGCPKEMVREGAERMIRAIREKQMAGIEAMRAAFDPEKNRPVCVYGPPSWFQNQEAEFINNTETWRM